MSRRSAETSRERRERAALCALLALVLAGLAQRVWMGPSAALLEGALLFVIGTALLLIARHLATP